MREQLIRLLEQENEKCPWTDEELAMQLGVLREEVTNLRKEEGIPDSRERRRRILWAAMKKIIQENPDISDRALSARLEAEGFQIKKFAAARSRQELMEHWQPDRTVSAEQKMLVHTGTKSRMQQQKKQEGESRQDFRNIFGEMIGADGSMKGQIAKAQAAVMYPPKGLHCLLVGPSGVGKSYMAELMHRFACNTEIFGKDAPYFEFNCADYADNPQLLLAQLFGYSKGAFTGANESKKGIVELCDGGILFLDEVHRLPPEGQEILFYLMDKGKFRRLGEVDVQRESHVLVIAATTENPDDSLLLTFRRRIPMTIEIPAVKERPLPERLEFIRRFFQWEAIRLGRKLRVEAEVVRFFLAGEYPGNVGQIKADIQVCCAKAFLESCRQNRKTVVVGKNHLKDTKKLEPVEWRCSQDILDITRQDLYLSPDDQPVNKLDFVDNWNIYEELEDKYIGMKRQGISDELIESSLTDEIESQLLYHIEEIQRTGFSKDEIGHIAGEKVLAIADEIYEQAKKELPSLSENVIFPLAIHLKSTLERMENCDYDENEWSYDLTRFEKEYRVARKINEEIRKRFYLSFPDRETGFIAMYLNRFRKAEASEQKVAVLVVSHGEVAEGMAEVANSVMGVHCAQGLNLKLWDTPEQMEKKVIRKVRTMETGRGLLLLADMGTLANVGQKIQERLGIPTATITRTDTMLVIEAVRKAMWMNEELSDIYQALLKKRPEQEKNNERSGKKDRKKAILCLCITGEGAARRLRDEISAKLANYIQQVEILTRGYMENAHVEAIIDAVSEEYEILAIVGTIDPGVSEFAFISSVRLLTGDGIASLRKLLKRKRLMETNRLSEVLTKDHIWIMPDVQYKEEVLDTVLGRLEQDGMVKPEFYLSVYKREGSMTTVLKHGIAIPHGDPGFVTKPAICITKLDNPIAWDGINAVDLVFTLALTENSKIYFEQLYQFLSDEILVNTLKNCKTSEEIIQVLTQNTESDN